MTANKTRTSRRRLVWNGDGPKVRTQPWRLAHVFNPLFAIIDQLEQEGTSDETEEGQAVMRANHDGYWYDSHAAIIGVVEAYEMHEARTGRDLGLAPLRQLAEKLHAGESIHQDLTDAVRACLNRMRAETQAMTIQYANDLTNTYARQAGTST